MSEMPPTQARVHRSGHSWRILATAILAAVWSLLAPHALAQVDYIYDEAGRLVGVIAPSGEAAQYVYDAAGNIVEIKRFTAGQLAVIEFTPNRGPVGTVVTIQGKGFSATPANNIVKFNGVSAVVSSATTIKLVVTVPAGATTGRITVQVGANTATSLTDFVVGADTASPTISGFSPTIGVFGTSVTITGTNFEPQPGNNQVRFNGFFAPATTASATSLTAAVPAAATSGKLTVATAKGVATSAADFFVVPPPLTAADISGTGRAILNGAAAAISIAAAGKSGLVIFDAAAGQHLGIGMTSLSLTGGSYVFATVYAPDWAQVGTFYCYTSGGNSCAVNLQNLPQTGTYSVVVAPQSGATGSLTMHVSTDLTGSLTPNTAFNLNVSRPGQNQRLTFSGTLGQVVALEFATLVLNPATSIYAEIRRPDGTYWSGANITPPGTTWTTAALPSTGTYTLIIEPSATYGAATITGKVTLESGTPITVNGAAVNGTIATTGESARFTFSGTAGQNLGVGMTTLVLTGGTYASIVAHKPDGTGWVTGYCYTNGNDCSINLANLPTTGTYSVVVQPVSGATGTFSLHLSTDVTGSLTLGTPATINITRNGQNARYTFSGTTGDLRQLSVSAASTVPAGQWMTYYFYKPPDGTYFTSTGGGGALTYAIPALPATGTYILVIEPTGQGAATANVTLTIAPR